MEKCKIICVICKEICGSLNAYNIHLRSKAHKNSYFLQTAPLPNLVINYEINGKKIVRVLEQCGCCICYYPDSYVRHYEDNKGAIMRWMTTGYKRQVETINLNQRMRERFWIVATARRHVSVISIRKSRCRR